MPFRHGAFIGGQCLCNSDYILNLLADFFLSLLDGSESSVDAASETLQLVMSAPPFLASKLRCKEARTSPKASAIRNPGGCSGPP